MFQLTTMRDTISLPPSHFGLPPLVALEAEANKKYANRVVLDVGLAICVFDFVKVGEGVVHYGDGCYWYKVTFRLVVFRPFIGEVILAKVTRSDSEKIRLSLNFFDDITLSNAQLPPGSCFDTHAQLYFFSPDSSHLSTTELLDTPKEQRNYIDAGSYMRIRVEAEEFADEEPGPPMANDGVIVHKERGRAPYSVQVSIVEQGLGRLDWWPDDVPDEEGDVEMGE